MYSGDIHCKQCTSLRLPRALPRHDRAACLHTHWATSKLHSATFTRRGIKKAGSLPVASASVALTDPATQKVRTYSTDQMMLFITHPSRHTRRCTLLTSTHTHSRRTLPWLDPSMSPEAYRLNEVAMPDTMQQELLRGYCASVTFMDHQVLVSIATVQYPFVKF